MSGSLSNSNHHPTHNNINSINQSRLFFLLHSTSFIYFSNSYHSQNAVLRTSHWRCRPFPLLTPSSRNHHSSYPHLLSSSRSSCIRFCYSFCSHCIGHRQIRSHDATRPSSRSLKLERLSPSCLRRAYTMR